MSVSSPSRAITIFISYATTSSEDTDGFNELDKHLSLLFSRYSTLQRYSSKLSDESPTTQLIEAHLNQANLIILLTSADYFASKQDEIQRAIALKDAKRARMIPVQLRPTDWNASPLSQYYSLPSDGEPVSLWPNSDAAFTNVVQGIRRVVDEVASQETNPTRLPSQSIILYDPPDPYDNFFTDRMPILEAISSFFTSASMNRTALLALSGLGGIGKTSIAKEYCDTSYGLYQDLFWLDASSRTTLSSYVNTLADRLSLPNTVRENELQFFAAVKQWLRDRPRWLLVLDQIQDIDLVDLIVPPHSRGNVLLTMRTESTRKHALFVPSMDVDAGALFLLRRAQILPAQAPLEQAPKEIIDQAKEIAHAMDGFPLALDQAGAYLKERGGGLANYLRLYKEQRAYLLNEHGQAADDHHTSVTRILTLTFDTLTDTLYLDLLHLLAFLHPNVILQGLLVNGAQELQEPLRSLVANPLTLHEALGKLHQSCLVRYRADGTVLQIQRIIQDVLIDRLTIEQRHHWAEQAVRVVNHAFPAVRFDTQAICERYMPQAQHCADLITQFDLTLKEGALLLERLGSFCSRRASYDDAKTYLTQALHLYKRHLRTDVLDTAQTLNSLGRLYHQQARYKKAKAYHQHALKLREQALGPDHPKTAESLHNLATIYGDLGEYQKAEHLYLRVISVEEHTKGPNDPDVADTLNNLGLTYSQQGRYTEAKKAYHRALAIYKRSLAVNHPDLAYPFIGLGVLAEKQGNYSQAEKFYKQALAIREHVFGKTHPTVARGISKLAGIAALRQNYQQAETLYRQALTMSVQILGPRHPDVAVILNDQALLATKQEQYSQARPLYQRALSIYILVLGKQNPAVANILNNLGQLSRTTGNKQRAEKLLRRALAIREKVLGSTHPSIAQSLGNLADLLTDQQRYTEAEPLFQQALDLYLNISDPRHPDIAHIPEKYALLLEQMNRNEEAKTLRKITARQEES